MDENKDNIMITSGYDFEGYRITKYLGLCSGEAALGTGFLSGLGAGIADLLGSNSAMYTDKLNDAREIALDTLIERAESLGANAVIAVHLEYTTFSSDIMGVSANGTAVKIERDPGYSEISLEIKSSDSDLPVKPVKLFLSAVASKCYATLLLSDIAENNIYALRGNLSLFTIFGEEFNFDNIFFCDFVNESNSKKISGATPLSFSPDTFRILKNATFEITKYANKAIISDGLQIDTISGNDVPPQEPIDPQLLNEYLYSVQTLKSAADIYDFTLEFNSSHNDFIPVELIKYIKAIASNERIYGNLAKDSIHTINKYFEKKS